MKYFDYRTGFHAEQGGLSVTYPLTDDETVLCGTSVNYAPPPSDKDDEYRLNEIEKRYGISFFFETADFTPNFYCVPLVDLFAYDKGGYYGTLNEFASFESNAPVIYIDKEMNAYTVSENYSSFIDSLLAGEKKPTPKLLSDIIIITFEKMSPPI